MTPTYPASITTVIALLTPTPTPVVYRKFQLTENLQAIKRQLLVSSFSISHKVLF